MEVTEMKTAAELNQTPPKFTPSTEGLPPPMDDNAVREIFAKAAADGAEDLNATITTTAPAPQGQPPVAAQPPVTAQPVQPPPVGTSVPQKEGIPSKFQKPDGTVDEEKLKASSARLDEAQKTVDDLLADYKAKEKEYHQKSAEAKQIQAQIPGIPNAPLMTAPLPPEAEAIRQQLLALQQQDPIAFAVEIARAVSRKEATDIAAPALQVAEVMAQQQRDSSLRGNISALADRDPRILNPQIYAEFQKELNDPSENYFALKNPHKAAWNEVKERLRLGEPTTAQAQPSNLSPNGGSPTLGRGSPTPVSGLPQPVTQAGLYAQAQTLKPYSEDAKKFEDQLRSMTSLGAGGWQ